MRFIGHLDLVRVWERAARRAGLPLAFTAGFSPRPRLHFGPALPTCFASTAEYLDLDLSCAVAPDETSRRLSAALPDGIDVVAAAVCGDRAESLQSAVTALEYVVALDGNPGGDALADASAALLAAERLPYELERKGRTRNIDLREGIFDVRVVPAADAVPRLALVPDRLFEHGPCLWMRLAAQPRSCRPTEVLDVLPTVDGATTAVVAGSSSNPPTPFRPRLCHRSAQLAGGPDALHEPLPVGGSALDQETDDGSFRTQTPPQPTPATP